MARAARSRPSAGRPSAGAMGRSTAGRSRPSDSCKRRRRSGSDRASRPVRWTILRSTDDCLNRERAAATSCGMFGAHPPGREEGPSSGEGVISGSGDHPRAAAQSSSRQRRGSMAGRPKMPVPIPHVGVVCRSSAPANNSPATFRRDLDRISCRSARRSMSQRLTSHASTSWAYDSRPLRPCDQPYTFQGKVAVALYADAVALAGGPL
jgi:hypothetical protein